MDRYSDIAFSEASVRHQRDRGSFDGYQHMGECAAPAGLGPDEVEFLTERDSIYVASTNDNGWPYVQHRGGPSGFIKVVSPTRIAWGERHGNKQYVSAGNIDHSDKIALIGVDYPSRRRLKLYGHATFVTDPDASLLASLDITGRLEGIVQIDVRAFDWNCPKFITPRYTAEHIRVITEPLQARIAQLEEALAQAVHHE
jgi:uncharacterized protein